MRCSTWYTLGTGALPWPMAGKNFIFTVNVIADTARRFPTQGSPYEEALVMRESSGVDSFYRLTQEVMRLPQPPDAIFTTSDPKAFVVMHALHDMGVRIPEDVSVLGFDNVSLSSMVEPPLSTVAQPLYDMGAVAAKT